MCTHFATQKRNMIITILHRSEDQEQRGFKFTFSAKRHLSTSFAILSSFFSQTSFSFMRDDEEEVK